MVALASGEDGTECGGVSIIGVDARLGSLLLMPVLHSSLSSSSQRADILPRERRECLLLRSPLLRGGPVLAVGGTAYALDPSSSRGGGSWKSGAITRDRLRVADVPEAAGILGGVSHRTSCAQSSSVYVSFWASSRECLRTVLELERVDVDEADLLPDDVGLVRELDEVVTAPPGGCAPRSEFAGVVTCVDAVCVGEENTEGGPSPLVVEATDEIEEPEGVRETVAESVSPSGTAGGALEALEWRRAEASAWGSSMVIAVELRDMRGEEANEVRGV